MLYPDFKPFVFSKILWNYRMLTLTLRLVASTTTPTTPTLLLLVIIAHAATVATTSWWLISICPEEKFALGVSWLAATVKVSAFIWTILKFGKLIVN